MKQFQLKQHPKIFWGLFISAVCLLLVAWHRINSSLVHAFDTGIYLQILSNFIDYGDFHSSITSEHNFMAHHFQPIVYLLTPFYMVWRSSMIFFGASILSTLLACWMFAKYFYHYFEDRKIIFPSMVISLFWYQSIAFRHFYGFVPEIFALPCFIYQTHLLLQKEKITNSQIWGFALSALVAGMCKENIWLVNFFVAGLLFIKNKEFRLRLFYLSCLNLAIFLFLFLYWMKAHTDMPSYYGLRYYLRPDVEGVGFAALIKSMCLNLFSLKSAQTLLFIGLSTAFLCCLGLNYALLGAVPGIAFVLTSSHVQVHELANQYGILFAGFLWGAAAYNLKNSMVLKTPIVRRLLVLLFCIITIYHTIISGIMSQFLIAYQYPHSGHVIEALDQVKLKLNKNSRILSDGSYVPLLVNQQRYVKMFLEFKGNPTSLTDKDFADTTDVITTAELRSLDGGCTRLKKSQQTRGLDYDYEKFYKYCNWLVNNKMVFDEYPDARLFHYHYPKKEE